MNKTKKKFVNPLNKQVGRRTGRDFKAGKTIRVGNNGFENFDDYLSESEAESFCWSEKRCHAKSRQPKGKENDTTNTKSLLCQSAPALDKASLVSSMTGEFTSLSQDSQVPMMKKKRTKFDWLRNRNIGRRTGKDMRANRVIRVMDNGLENFDDFLSDSEAESFLSSTMKNKSMVTDDQRSNDVEKSRNVNGNDIDLVNENQHMDDEHRDEDVPETGDDSDENDKIEEGNEDIEQGDNEQKVDEKEEDEEEEEEDDKFEEEDEQIVEHEDGNQEKVEEEDEEEEEEDDEFEEEDEQIVEHEDDNQEKVEEEDEEDEEEEAEEEEDEQVVEYEDDNECQDEEEEEDEQIHEDDDEQKVEEEDEEEEEAEEEEDEQVVEYKDDSECQDEEEEEEDEQIHEDDDKKKVEEEEEEEEDEHIVKHESDKQDVDNDDEQQELDNGDIDEHIEGNEYEDDDDDEQELDNASEVDNQEIDNEEDTDNEQEEVDNEVAKGKDNIEVKDGDKSESMSEEEVDKDMEGGGDNTLANIDTHSCQIKKPTDGKSVNKSYNNCVTANEQKSCGRAKTDKKEKTNRDHSLNSKYIGKAESNVINDKEDLIGNEDLNDLETSDIRLSQGLSGLDVAGNKSGSITKLDQPGSVVTFNRTKKRLSYSAVVKSDESKKSRARRLEQANLELAKQTIDRPSDDESISGAKLQKKRQTEHKEHSPVKPNANVQHKSYSNSNDFLCLSTRSVHVTQSSRHPDGSDDDDDDISIIDDVKSRFKGNKSSVTDKSNKSKNSSTLKSVTKKGGKLKENNTSSKGRKTKGTRQSAVKEPVKNIPSEKEERKGVRKRNSTVKTKPGKVNRKLADYLGISDDDGETKDSPSNVNDLSNDEYCVDNLIPEVGSVEATIEESDTGRGKKEKQMNKGTIQEKAGGANTKKVKRKNSSDISTDDASPKKKGKTNNKNSKSTKTVNEKRNTRKRKSSEEESSDIDNEIQEGNAAKSNKKSGKRLTTRSSRQSSSSSEESRMSGTKHLNATPEPDTRHISTNFESGVSFRVTRRSEILEKVTSGPLNKGDEIEIEMGPSAGLTPCLSRKGQARRSKGRRVTICPEENTQHILSADEASDENTSTRKFRHSMGLSVVGTPLPSPNSTPKHIFECTKTETPPTISKLPKCYAELPIEDRCIHPVPAPEGLRRSKRTRLPPVATYKNEEIIWEHTEDGPIIVGVKPSMEMIYNKRDAIMRQKKRLKHTLKKVSNENQKKKTRKLSIHVDMPKDFEISDKHEVTVVDPETQELCGIECIAHKDAYQAVGPDGNPASSSSPFRATKLIEQSCVTVGTLDIMPRALKTFSRVVEPALVFRILFGKVLVSIHETTSLLETDDTFLVPYGNVYSIKNLRNDTAKLFYVVSKFQDKEQSYVDI